MKNIYGLIFVCIVFIVTYVYVADTALGRLLFNLLPQEFVMPFWFLFGLFTTGLIGLLAYHINDKPFMPMLAYSFGYFVIGPLSSYALGI